MFCIVQKISLKLPVLTWMEQRNCTGEPIFSLDNNVPVIFYFIWAYAYYLSNYLFFVLTICVLSLNIIVFWLI